MKIVRNIITVTLTVIATVALVITAAGVWSLRTFGDTSRSTAGANLALTSPGGRAQLARMIEPRLHGRRASYASMADALADEPVVLEAAEHALGAHLTSPDAATLGRDVLAAAIGPESGQMAIDDVAFPHPDGVVGFVQRDAGAALGWAAWVSVLAMAGAVWSARRRDRQIRRFGWVLRVLAVGGFVLAVVAAVIPETGSTPMMTVILHDVAGSVTWTMTVGVVSMFLAVGAHLAALAASRFGASRAARRVAAIGPWDEYRTVDPHAASQPVRHWTAPGTPAPFTLRQPPLPAIDTKPPWPPIDDPV